MKKETLEKEIEEIKNKYYKEILEEIKKWQKRYNGKFKSASTFWEMFYEELENNLLRK